MPVCPHCNKIMTVPGLEYHLAHNVCRKEAAPSPEPVAEPVPEVKAPDPPKQTYQRKRVFNTGLNVFVRQ